jgi:hypothetical protein
MRKNNNSTDSSLYESLIRLYKRVVRVSKIAYKLYRKTSFAFSKTFQRIQLTCIYACAILVLIFSLQQQMGYFPDSIMNVFPRIDILLKNGYLQRYMDPDKTFIVYVLVQELVLARKFTGFSTLVKYNVILIFVLELMQQLVTGWWDLFFRREIDFSLGTTIIVRGATELFYCGLFYVTLGLYVYSYVQSFRNIYPAFPGILKAFTDSVAFWLRIRTFKRNKKK